MNETETKTFKDVYGDHTGEIYKGDLYLFAKSEITSLEGCYKEIHGNFDCSSNNLTSLYYGPKKVTGKFVCTDNKLLSLKGAPKIVGTHFLCSFNEIENLEGAPEIINGNFFCANNHLNSLKGAPKKINGKLKLNKNPYLKSLDDILGTEINGEVVSDIISNIDFKKKQQIYKIIKDINKTNILKGFIDLGN